VRIPYAIARFLMPFATVASPEVCEAFGRPGRSSLRLSEIPKAELEKRLWSGGIFVNYRNDRLRIYCE
jgi:hypothetical protein